MVIGLGGFSLAILALASTMPAVAADDFISGVYAPSEDLCAQARTEGLQTVLEAGNVLLTARGFEGIEYHCEFLDVTKAARSAGWLANALCEQPGHAFPDVVSIMPRAEGQLEITSVRVADPDDAGGNGGTYFQCEGVEAP
ncbi:hypothetical protein MesoLjLc_46110 [Mesorhizobium sp. L-8-10]|uniref:hypothetical protein n=1 Tax=unclassified Mesorhizobium TaxID=325217 RepID=UPI001935E54A|nr:MULTISPECIES: hypothetical protein [unclassified Mesorhizobium]BCH24892.1 hypothetical protein MesoLjLb_46770 [Mesorhizobium sp. L-8-3]BCH32681.1 hypothetical protein MesoLjLc_46110 [Mesorhizobium sp. L-8-10]